MGKSTSDGSNEDCCFFFELLHNVKDTFPIVFGGGGRNKPHSKAYRDFKEKWGFVGTLYETVDEKIEKIEKIYQLYLADFLQYLSYMIEKGEMEEEEEAFQETLRKAKSKTRR